MPEILKVKDLTKVFNRRIQAVNTLPSQFIRERFLPSSVLTEREKATSLKMFCGLAKPTSGEVRLAGISLPKSREEKYLRAGACFPALQRGYGPFRLGEYAGPWVSSSPGMGRALKDRITSLLKFAGLLGYETLPVKFLRGNEAEITDCPGNSSQSGNDLPR